MHSKTKKSSKLFWLVVLMLIASAVLPVIALNQHEFISNPHRIPGLKRLGEGIYYGERIAIFNCLVLVSLLIYRKVRPEACLSFFSGIEEWIQEKSYRNARLSVTFFVGIFIIAFFFKLHFIFALRGNPGWTYKNITLPTEMEVPDYFTDSIPPLFLNKAISMEAFKYQELNGFIVGDAYFMHFNDGQVLPFNLNLLRNTHPLKRFGLMLERQQGALIKIMEKTYTNLQNGVSTWLPVNIALPNHIVRQHIDYSDYPPFNQLNSISVWKVLLKVEVGNTATIEKALLSNEIFIKDFQ